MELKPYKDYEAYDLIVRKLEKTKLERNQKNKLK